MMAPQMANYWGRYKQSENLQFIEEYQHRGWL
jgi:hypothetical protein